MILPLLLGAGALIYASTRNGGFRVGAARRMRRKGPWKRRKLGLGSRRRRRRVYGIAGQPIYRPATMTTTRVVGDRPTKNEKIAKLQNARRGVD